MGSRKLKFDHRKNGERKKRLRRLESKLLLTHQQQKAQYCEEENTRISALSRELQYSTSTLVLGMEPHGEGGRSAEQPELHHDDRYLGQRDLHSLGQKLAEEQLANLVEEGGGEEIAPQAGSDESHSSSTSEPGEPARRSQRLQQQRKRQLQEWEDEDALVRAAASSNTQQPIEFGIMHQLEKHRGRGRPSKVELEERERGRERQVERLLQERGEFYSLVLVSINRKIAIQNGLWRQLKKIHRTN